MKVLQKFIGEHRHFLYLLIFVPLLLIFYLCQKFISPKYIMYCRYDDYIPFLSVFIIPYMFWFAYIGIGFVYFGLKSKSDFIKLVKFIFWGMGVSYAAFIVFPSGQNLRPILTDKGIFSALVGFIYSIDPPANVCPSIHVINSIGVNAVVCKSELFQDRRIIKVISSIIMILICASTLFIKQHSIIDVMAGIGLSIVLYFFIYVIPRVRQHEYDRKITN